MALDDDPLKQLHKRCIDQPLLCNMMKIKVRATGTAEASPTPSTPNSGNLQGDSDPYGKVNLRVLIPVVVILSIVAVVLFVAFRFGRFGAKFRGPAQELTTPVPKAHDDVDEELEMGRMDSRDAGVQDGRNGLHAPPAQSVSHVLPSYSGDRSSANSSVNLPGQVAPTPWDPTDNDHAGDVEARLSFPPPAYRG